MLRTLHISNYILIDHLDLTLDKGFSVITGETGAGKSILLGALGLLTGRRAEAKAIKADAKKCVVEANFAIDATRLQDFFTNNDIDGEGTECIIRREVTATGKSRAFINDTPVALNTLRELTSQLVDIHSQHQNLLMGDEHFLLNILDANETGAAHSSEYKQKYQAWREARNELQRLEEEASQNASEAEYMQFQLSQLDEAQLCDGEQEELEAEQEQLAHSEEIKAAFFRVSSHLSDEQLDISGLLRSDSHELNSIASIYPKAAALEERIESARIELEDIAAEAEQIAESLDFDPQRLEYVEERLALIFSLLKKHRKETVKELIELTEDLRTKLSRIENADELIAAKRTEVEATFKQLKQIADELSLSRKQTAQKLTERMLQLTEELGMPAAKLQFQIEQHEPAPNGQDEIKLLFSANKDLPLQDVAQVASGGEIARLMLALKAVIAEQQALPTIIFDEIDTGVSGRMADAMAGVMNKMAHNCQVICITHLPQIAAAGTIHYKVYKETAQGATISYIKKLSSKEREQEIASMLSGQDVTEAAITNAQELLKGRHFKENTL